MNLSVKVIVFFISIFANVMFASSVTFNLNMSTAGAVTDSTHSIVLRGNFNNWAGSDMPLSSIGGDYYTYTGSLDPGSYEFKFVAIDNLTSTDGWEDITNRSITVSANDTTITCYWENGDQPPYTATDSIDIWFRVNTCLLYTSPSPRD